MGTKATRYPEEFKKQIVTLHQNGKTFKQIETEFGVSSSAVCEWIKKYSEIRMPDDTIMTAIEIDRLRKRNAELEEENIILKKASAIFMQHSKKD